MWLSGSGWEQTVSAWRTSGPSMEGAWVHFNLSWRRCQFRQRSDRAFAYHSMHSSTPPQKSVSLEWHQQWDPNLSEIFVGPPVMYGAVRPFLEVLKTGPTGIPFSKYLVLRGDIWLISQLIHGMRLLPAFCGTSPLHSRKGTVFGLMRKMLRRSPMWAKYCGMRVLWTQVKQRLSSIV